MDNGFLSRRIGPPHAAHDAQRGRTPSRATGESRILLWTRQTSAWLQRRGGKRLLRDISLLCGTLIILYGVGLWWTLPNVSDPRNFIASQSSVIVDRNGTELYRLFNEQDRTFIPGSDIPQHMKDAIVAIEDQRFRERGCLDLRALARAALHLGASGGASTLTRQLARNALNLKKESLISRKLKELILGCTLEHQYTKEQLLELYLNWIPFGQSVYGLEQASETYFGIHAKDLSLAQSAVLAALPQRPTYFSPYGAHLHTRVTGASLQGILSGRITKASAIPDHDLDVGLLGARIGSGALALTIGGRTDQVLKNMADLKTITEGEREKALEDLATLTFQRRRESIRAPHFVLWVKQQTEELVASGSEESILNQAGLTIETTLDWNMQQAAEQAIKSRKDDFARIYSIHNEALVAADPRTGEILAYVGNGDYNDETRDGKVDMARAPRQPGSSFKPFVYAAAFEKGYGPATILEDVPTKIGNDQPQNFDGYFWGLLSARRALAGSRNIPAAKAFFLSGGEESVLDMAHRLGVVTPLKTKSEMLGQQPHFAFGWPLALGAAETPLIEMVQGYATLANAGTFHPLFGIRRIKDKSGNILFEAKTEDQETQAIDPRIAYEVTSILSDVSARPNEYWQTILTLPGTQAAAKTGTSNKCLERPSTGSGQAIAGKLGACMKRKPSDLWTIGYTPSLIAGVWVGNANAEPLADKAESLTNASPIWKDFMTRAQKFITNPVTSFPVPSGIIQPQISLLSGQLPTLCTPIEQRRGDVFLQENAPNLQDPACARLEVDQVTGLLASDECPASARQMQSFYVPHALLGDRFPAWQQSLIDWASTGSGKTQLPLPLAPTEKCTLALTPGRTEQPKISLSFPQDGEGVSYPSFRPQIVVHVASSVRDIRYDIDGALAARVFSGATLPSLRVPPSIPESGTHTLTVTLTDRYFNTATAEVSFHFEKDVGGPVVRLITPADASTIQSGESVHIEAQAEDTGSGIKYIEFYLDEELLTRKPRAPYALDYVLSSPGPHTLRAVATDLAGNTAEDSVMITVQ